MEHKRLEDILDLVLEFAQANKQILAVGLCGSRARGTAKPDSDIDLSILTEDKESFKNTG